MPSRSAQRSRGRLAHRGAVCSCHEQTALHLNQLAHMSFCADAGRLLITKSMTPPASKRGRCHRRAQLEWADFLVPLTLCEETDSVRFGREPALDGQPEAHEAGAFFVGEGAPRISSTRPPQ